MIADELRNPVLPFLKPTDSVGKALDWMEEFHTDQLAVVDGQTYQGLVSEETLLSMDDTLPIDAIPPQYAHVFASEYQHLFEVVNLAQHHSIRLVPVLDAEAHFLGSILMSDLLQRFIEQLGFQEPGAILVLVLKERNYSLTEISRLVESNDTKIVGSYFGSLNLAPSLEGGELSGRLTLKLNRRNVEAVLATLERFGYSVEGVYAHEPLENDERGRLDALLRYLDI